MINLLKYLPASGEAGFFLGCLKGYYEETKKLLYSKKEFT